MRRFLRTMTDGGGQLFTPASVSGLFLWLDATSITLPDSSRVPLWVDKSGNGRNASQGVVNNQPMVQPEGPFDPRSPSGKRGVSFFRAIPWWMGGPLPGIAGVSGGIPNTNGQSYYLWFWEALAGGSGDQIPWQDETGGRPQLYTEALTGNPAWRDVSNTRAFGTPLTIDFHSLVWNFAPPTGGTGIGTIYLDGVALGSGTWNWNDGSTAGSYFLGANQVANSGFGGLIYELLCYQSAHTTAQRTLLLNYGRKKWGI